LKTLIGVILILGGFCGLFLLLTMLTKDGLTSECILCGVASVVSLVFGILFLIAAGNAKTSSASFEELPNYLGESDLSTLLTSLKPVIAPDEFVFISRPSASYGEGTDLKPVAAFTEQEGLTLVVTKQRADSAGERYSGVFRMITLQVHSSLEAVGLTAAVANALSQRGISANVVAAFYHDHLFVPNSRANDAMVALNELASQ